MVATRIDSGWVCALLLGFSACSPEASAKETAAPERVELTSTLPVEAGITRVPEARPNPREGALQSRFERVIADTFEKARRFSQGRAHAGNIQVAVNVIELGNDPVELVSRNADRVQRPASNMKLVTTTAALVLLGPQQEFSTIFEGDGLLVDGTLQGDLIVRASGDPLWHPEGRAEERFQGLGQQLLKSGVRCIEGDLVLDEGSFLQPGPGPGWPDPSQHWDDYCALAGGFSVQGGVLWAVVTPRAVGSAARVEVHPSPHGLRSSYGVETVRGGRVDVRVGATSAKVTVKGALPAGREPFIGRFAHPDPVALFGSVLIDQLRASGIEVRGKVRRERNVTIAQPFPEPLADLRSSLDELFVPINSESDNSVADQLFLALGHSVADGGTRAGGAQAIGRALERLGISSAGLVQVDGSGLSRDNRISARQITALLEAVLAGPRDTAALLLNSLAVAGRSGTLAKRLAKTPSAGRIFAKTGWIAGTSALSGVAHALDGRTLVFSILVDYPAALGGMNTNCFKPMQDRLCAILVEEGVP